MLRLFISIVAMACACLVHVIAVAATAFHPPAQWTNWLAPATFTFAPVNAPGPFPDGAAPRDPAWLQRWGHTTPVLAWNDILLELIVKYQQNPLRATRALALVHAAQHDAAISCARVACAPTTTRIALHAAAAPVLKHLYPQESPGRLEALAHSAIYATIHVMPQGANVNQGWALGNTAAHAAIARALDDGSDLPRDLATRPQPRPGLWRAAPPLNIHDPAEPRAPEWRTWVLKNSAEIEPPPPIAFGSTAYRAEMEEVQRTTKNLTPEQKAIADNWNLDLGTVTPAGVWNNHARGLALEHKLNDANTTLLYAALNIAMADAFVAAWHAKYKWWTQRPITAIRDTIDPAFKSHIITPPFPGYVSGHAAISGAASKVLSAFFPQREKQLEQMAEVAALSRLYGGIHFRSDNAEGLNLGRAVGQRVVTRLPLVPLSPTR